MVPNGAILGYHGCAESLARRVVLREAVFEPSENGNDWLGKGIYFWAHDPVRAREWSGARAARQVGHPAVIGAVIELGNCLNLAERAGVEWVSEAHRYLLRTLEMEGELGALPMNNGGNRRLDYLVMETLHQLRGEQGLPPYDTVIGYFGEGQPIYEGAELRHQNHLQICVRRPSAIVGCFLA